MMNAVALHGMVNQSGQILGPAAAGGIIELVGIGPTLVVNAGLYLSGNPSSTRQCGHRLIVDFLCGLHCYSPHSSI